MNHRSRSTLFLMEQLIVIAVFAICASICVRILFESYNISVHSTRVSNATHIVESAAECIKATAGDIEKAANILGGGVPDGGSITVFYDQNWQVCGPAGASYSLTLSGTDPVESSSPLVRKVWVSEIGGRELISLTVAARRDGA